MGTVLLVVLILILLGGIPSWGPGPYHWYGAGWWGGGGIGLVLLIVLILVLLGRL